MEITEPDVSQDTSACYEDYTLNMNENIADECPASKKRKIHAQEKVIQEDVAQEKPMLSNYCDTATNGCKTFPQDQHQNQNQQHYNNTSILTAHIEPPNLSESDSNDSIPVISSNKMLAYIFYT